MVSKEFLKKVKATFSIEGCELINEFFITFSRFECVLKASIEFANGSENKVEPNWDKFISSISTKFNLDKNIELKSAGEYILMSPPKIQSLSNNQLAWKPRLFPQLTLDIQKLNLHIRDIRNNLFHGGKFNGNYEPDVSRNYILIKSSLIILNDWLTLNPLLEKDFLSSFS